MSLRTLTSNLPMHLAWIGTPRCTCPWRWKSLGTLYRVSMGKGWVRMTTDQACPHHGGTSQRSPRNDQTLGSALTEESL